MVSPFTFSDVTEILWVKNRWQELRWSYHEQKKQWWLRKLRFWNYNASVVNTNWITWKFARNSQKGKPKEFFRLKKIALILKKKRIGKNCFKIFSGFAKEKVHQGTFVHITPGICTVSPGLLFYQSDQSDPLMGIWIAWQITWNGIPMVLHPS